MKPTLFVFFLLMSLIGTTISDFTFPWSDKPAPPTTFKAKVVGDRLHFSFDVTDSDVICSKEWKGESTVDHEDRVEIFIAKDNDLHDYWCIEIDPEGRVHDYYARHYRKFDSKWNCPGLKTLARRTDHGYEVETSLPLATLSDLLGEPIQSGSRIRIGLFRAEFYGTAEGSRGEANDNWISWVKPTTQNPDFHIPSAFREWQVP
ncbi:carbohydrate-binding family 9-like protein [Schlesneria sp. T3-172]|uniref:carbohydrate-binding family 9-like protein n=1 Tax=Schlesneria TaxID=656899 RepID=UPI002EF95950